jgi:hypothetical protein
MAKQLDPLKIAERTYKQFARLLDMLEDEANTAEVTIPQLINALKALMSYDLTAIRKASEPEYVGSSVTKFTRAFSQNAARSRAKNSRRAAAAIAAVDDDGESGED